MSAYNWIEIKEKCPACGKVSDFKFQTYMASSYDGKNHTRFHDSSYKVGDKMDWFDKDHEKYGLWNAGNSKNRSEKNTGLECCYGTCLSCNTECYAIIIFEACVISNIKSLGVLEEWPDEFYK